MKKSFVLSIALFLISVTSVSAADFLVDFHVPVGQPVFSSANMKPGDVITKTIDVKNTSTGSRQALLRGVRTGGVGDLPPLEEALVIVIQDGSTVLYGDGSATGHKTVKDFFTDSIMPSFVSLTSITSNQTKSYTVTITFPLSSGNEYQGKSVTFDLYIDTAAQINAQKLLINEVFYRVDQSHWHGLVRDRRDDDHDHDDGGWYRDWFWQRRWWVFKKDFQWIELYNPTDKEITLKGWSVTTKDRTRVRFSRSDKIKAHGFALIAKDDVPWRYWNVPRGVTKVDVERNFGNGLDPKGDRLILTDSHGVEVDKMSWGTDTSGFTPLAINPEVARGSSTERKSLGLDTNTVGDWHEVRPATPGR